MINLQGSAPTLQGSGAGGVSLPTPSQPTQQNNSPSQPTPASAPVVTSQPTIPEYLTRDQARTLLQAAKDKGIDPTAALKSLITQGHIIEGVNDQNYQPDTSTQDTGNQDKQKMGVVKGVANAAENTATGVVKGVGQVFNNITQPIANFLSKPFASKQQIQANTDFNEQSYTPKGTSQKVGAAIGKTLPAVAAGLTGQVELAGPLTAAGASPLVAGSIAQGIGAGAEAFAGTKGSVGQRTKTGLTQGVEQSVFNYGLGKLFPILGLGGGEYSNQKAYDQVIKGVSDMQGFQKAIDAESGNFANILDETAAQVKLPSQIAGDLNELATKYRFNLPEGLVQSTETNLPLSTGGTFKAPFTEATLDPSEAQKLLMQMGKVANKSGYPTDLMDAINGLTQSTTDSLNAHADGLGDEFSRIYTDWRTRTDVMKPVFDVFKSENPVAGPELSKDLARAQEIANGPGGKQIIQAMLKNIKDIGGPDLTSTINAAKSLQAIQNPVVQKQAAKLLKNLGLIGAGSISTAVLGPKISKFFSAILGGL